jgi:hypothetical protein
MRGSSYFPYFCYNSINVVFGPSGNPSPVDLAAHRLGIFLLCFLVGMGVAAGAPVAITFGLASSVTALIAWRFPFPVFNIWIALSMLLGILVGIYTGEVRIGERVFSAYVELAVGEVIALGILAAWAFRILTLWRGRHDRNWEPWLPLLLPFLALIGAHILSGFSEGEPAWGEVIKFVGRYLVFVYLTSIALVVNFVRSKKRLRDALLILFLVGIAFALDGLRNMISFDGGFSLNRAMPGPILEVNPLGGNQHSLAEVELIAIACGLALARAAQTRSDASLHLRRLCLHVRHRHPYLLAHRLDCCSDPARYPFCNDLARLLENLSQRTDRPGFDRSAARRNPAHLLAFSWSN